jgi:hypothetical protein
MTPRRPLLRRNHVRLNRPRVRDRPAPAPEPGQIPNQRGEVPLGRLVVRVGERGTGQLCRELACPERGEAGRAIRREPVLLRRDTASCSPNCRARSRASASAGRSRSGSSAWQ